MTVKVHFWFQTVPEIQQLDLVAVSGECDGECDGECEVNCGGRRDKCDVSVEERRVTNVSTVEQTAKEINNEIHWRKKGISAVCGNTL